MCPFYNCIVERKGFPISYFFNTYKILWAFCLSWTPTSQSVFPPYTPLKSESIELARRAEFGSQVCKCQTTIKPSPLRLTMRWVWYYFVNHMRRCETPQLNSSTWGRDRYLPLVDGIYTNCWRKQLKSVGNAVYVCTEYSGEQLCMKLYSMYLISPSTRIKLARNKWIVLFLCFT